ncbi:hypothetical protein Tco_0876371 [Tanacetum coccineum]|uniref:Uncharacterized protein n=1 Tax=Tanacetum coccineum TaxID=301880 RepID=A0ABQ5BS39_9ASTR
MLFSGRVGEVSGWRGVGDGGPVVIGVGFAALFSFSLLLRYGKRAHRLQTSMKALASVLLLMLLLYDSDYFKEKCFQLPLPLFLKSVVFSKSADTFYPHVSGTSLLDHSLLKCLDFTLITGREIVDS